MQILNFKLHNFCRTAWTSDSAQQVWAPRLQRISTAWHEIEWLAVVDGQRSCALTHVAPDSLPATASRWFSNGLIHLPLQVNNVGHYSTYTTKVDSSKPISIRSVVGSQDSLKSFQSAWNGGNQTEIGRLLGYPECCVRFFNEVWVNQTRIDTTWPMCGSGGGTTFVGAVDSETLYANILWRWLGVRFVPHLPCSFQCEETCRKGRAYAALLRRHGYGNEANWMEQILAWPVEWSALHGIAEIKTPILKVSTNTDATGAKYTVRLEGTRLPRENGQGSTFPWSQSTVLKIGSERDNLTSNLANEEIVESQDWFVSDNGFSSRVGMYEEHERLLAAFQELTGVSADQRFSVLDLGCGNGALLKRLQQRYPGAKTYGVESDGDRIAHTSLVHPGCGSHFKKMNMFDLTPDDFDEAIDFVFLMPGRLLEVNGARAQQFRTVLSQLAEKIIVYAYNDTVKKHNGLVGLCEKTGLQCGQVSGSAGIAETSDRKV